MKTHPGKILIVEDEAIVALRLNRILESRGYDVIGPAISGKEAVELVKRENPDLILMDILLRGEINGIDAAIEIQSRFDIPVIYITASTDEQNLNRAKETRPYGYLIKPVKEYELFTSVETALNRHRLEKRIKESEEFNSSLLENAPIPIIVINPDSSVKYVNPAMEKLTGFPSADIIGEKPPYPWWIEKKQKKAMNYIEEALKRQASGIEEIFQKRDGERFLIEITSIPAYKNEELIYYLENWIDITEQKRLEKEILDISERERIRIGHDLHDGIGQDLTGIGYLFRVLMNKISNGDLPEELETEQIMGIIDEAKTHVRMLSKGLCPVNMGEKGIAIAVDELCRNAERIFDVRCKFSYDDDIYISDNASATHIYYIIQESLNNAVKHGKAGNIEIYMRKNNGGVEISIEDDGTGFKEKPKGEKGLGLDLMRFRAGIIDGTLELREREPCGTIVKCTIERTKIK